MICLSKFRLFALPFLLACLGCTQPKTDVLVTTTIIQDAAQRIAGDKLTVESLMGPGTDPHRYQPSAGDLGSTYVLMGTPAPPRGLTRLGGQENSLLMRLIRGLPGVDVRVVADPTKRVKMP